MTTFNLTCEAVEATLPDYLDGTLEGWVRSSIEEHLAECARCTGLARDLRNNAREAAALPALLPERDPWPRIAGRIGVPVTLSEPLAESAPAPFTPTAEPIVLASEAAPPTAEPPVLTPEPPVLTTAPLALTPEPPVVTTEPPAPVSEPLLPSPKAPARTSAPRPVSPSRREKSWRPQWTGLTRAAALVLVTAGTTFLLTREWLGPARVPNVAIDMGTGKRVSNERLAAEPGIRGPSAGRGQLAPDSIAMPPSGQLGSALTVSAISAAQLTPSPEDVVYDKEINVLQRIVRRQRAELDTSTVAEIEKNLRTLDSAIAQIRAALKRDPGSSLLGGQASRTLEMKVELLRRAAMLRSST
ncbi:MAG TPA: zf-HC2 domain-containing protein [Gemmatimonadaceae bacterium]|nr:zf-HC2 domain-containing protein [Gemmatimonadaceae bacterium]